MKRLLDIFILLYILFNFLKTALMALARDTYKTVFHAKGSFHQIGKNYKTLVNMQVKKKSAYMV